MSPLLENFPDFFVIFVFYVEKFFNFIFVGDNVLSKNRASIQAS